MSERIIDEPAAVIERPSRNAVLFYSNGMRVHPGVEFFVGGLFEADGLLVTRADQ